MASNQPNTIPVEEGEVLADLLLVGRERRRRRRHGFQGRVRAHDHGRQRRPRRSLLQSFPLFPLSPEQENTGGFNVMESIMTRVNKSDFESLELVEPHWRPHLRSCLRLTVDITLKQQRRTKKTTSTTVTMTKAMRAIWAKRATVRISCGCTTGRGGGDCCTT